ncbi:anti-sigma-I factor RsgI6-like [Littorina saxatilis]|uniref:GH10 domain-containing protein n=1 Tax=Littorina saxatilis TaxID=31220 RepID=A0AAN9BG07_9CAEN
MVILGNLIALAALSALTAGELLQNADFESLDHWDCWNSHCSLSSDRHSGQHSLNITGRSKDADGPSQYIQVTGGQVYKAGVWVKLLNDHAGQNIELMNNYYFTDGSGKYEIVARHANAKTSDGWIHLQGIFTAPTNKPIKRLRPYIQSGPEGSVGFLTDSATITPASGSGGDVTFTDLNHVIDQQRKSNIVLHVTTAAGINKNDVQIHVLQKKKSFPFGTAVNSWKYNSKVAGGKYGDFVHNHFNWMAPESAVKWKIIEPQRGQKDYDLALKMIHSVRSHGLKVRGSNLVWSVPSWVPNWVKELSGNTLRTEVKNHIEETMNKTRGLLEQWDVNNENLHFTWYQDRLHDSDYDLELFRIAHHADSSVKLFLNDYDVVAAGSETSDYLAQAQRFKKANVGLYGMGVQCHFGSEQEPDPTVIKGRLDILAQAGIPIWVSELDVIAQDENKRADFYEKALRALYGHPAVEGIIFWGFWDQAHWRGEKASLVKGNDLQMTAAGRRVFDLLENQWMTDETHNLSGSQMTVRGFHGDYEVHVIYQGRELSSLNQTFTLSKGTHTVNINVHK